jgi:RNA polymerase primary sigma factor
MPKQELLGEVKKLINLGKEKGFLTYDDLNSTLPADVVSSDQFSTIMTMFGEMDIEIVESAETERAPKAAEGEEAIEESEESEASEDNEKEIDLTPGALSRTDDPVRLYLKEMGSVALLSREGEIEIAKRIEEGKKDIATVVYGLPMTLEFVLNLRDQLKNGKIDVREIVPVVETEEDFEEEAVEKDYEELRVKTLDSLNAVRKVSASLKDLYDKARHVGADPEKQKKLRKQIDTVRGQVVDKMESVNLHGVLKDRMTQRVRDLNLLFRQAEREVTSCQRRSGCRR